MSESYFLLSAFVGGSAGGMLAARQFKLPVWKGAILALGSYLPAAIITPGFLAQLVIQIILAAIIASMMGMKAREASTVLIGFYLFTIVMTVLIEAAA
ncbi:MAG: hypothetical protein KUA43_13875 [Hoeflea sp.]|uniref:hypothetical protein n=1 Tax=Hoeflea sp. TaxID=1940281 RepID=UPI001DFC4CA2|nr:hypothetical protein [Hoeflea sp.]MBU4531247.1 hypothetical protein [Alphaproteobacteria bacterium]MBU4545690.1 hypothetical protein [Alphaproteobacteria bacterium]MBU4550659.1 hypothetical protein [Alphaproteobacteria bacterium]MBV1724524.1 hypothetical protein [Hoeflea sp.]MBV1760544.1 hypothetical protein [Hoeflea sp.]